jgi:hypothetical protein
MLLKCKKLTKGYEFRNFKEFGVLYNGTKKPKNNDNGFQIVNKLTCFGEKIFWSIFYIRGDPYQNK